MTEFNPFADLALPSTLAEELGTTPQTVMTWIEKAKLKPKFEDKRTKLFSRIEVTKAGKEYGKGSKAGYVHPDKYAALESLHREVLMREVELIEKYNDLLANFNTLQSEYDATVTKHDELMDKAERSLNERLYDKSLTDDEMDALVESSATALDELIELEHEIMADMTE